MFRLLSVTVISPFLLFSSAVLSSLPLRVEQAIAQESSENSSGEAFQSLFPNMTPNDSGDTGATRRERRIN